MTLTQLSLPSSVIIQIIQKQGKQQCGVIIDINQTGTYSNLIMQKQNDEIIYISFNQDQTYFAVSTQKGFKIFKLDQEIILALSRDFGAGIGIIQMIHKTNIFALVGGGKIPRHPKNKMMLWQDFSSKCITQICCRSEVKSVRINPEKCIIVLQTKIFVFNLADFKILDVVQTCPNPKGLCAISSMKQILIFAYPTKKLGTIQISVEGSEKKKIQVHKSTVCALQLCPNGYKLATASQKGTIIRIFNIATCECIQQLRRGSQYATIHSIAFDINSSWLACSSDSGTVHIFSLKKVGEQGDKQAVNKKSKLSFISKIVSYFDSQWSFASFHTNQKKTKVAFIGQTNQLAIVSYSGNVSIVKFNPQKSGDCERVGQYNLFELQSRS